MQRKKLYLLLERASKCFGEHEKSDCHRADTSFSALKSKYIAELTIQNLSDSRKSNRSFLIMIMKCLRCLDRQGVAIQGIHGEDNCTQLLNSLRTKDSSIIHKLNQATLKYTHQNIQNELVDIRGKQILTKMLERIIANGFYSIMCDEDFYPINNN